MNYITVVIATVGTTIGAGYSSGQVVSKTVESMARQPGTSGQFRTAIFIGATLVEAVPILGVIIALALVFATQLNQY